MYTAVMLMHAAEMMLPADNGCYTTMFPLCTWGCMAKIKIRL